MSEVLGLLPKARTRLCHSLVAVMLATAAFRTPASAQRASVLTSAPGAQLDSAHRHRIDAVAPSETPGPAPVTTVIASSAATSIAVGAAPFTVVVRTDTGAVGDAHSDSAAAARHPGRVRFWRFAHVGMVVGAVAGLGYGLSQAPHCACGYFLGGTPGMVVAYTGAGSLFGFDAGSVAYLGDRLARRVARHGQGF